MPLYLHSHMQVALAGLIFESFPTTGQTSFTPNHDSGF